MSTPAGSKKFQDLFHPHVYENFHANRDAPVRGTLWMTTLSFSRFPIMQPPGLRFGTAGTPPAELFQIHPHELGVQEIEVKVPFEQLSQKANLMDKIREVVSKTLQENQQCQLILPLSPQTVLSLDHLRDYAEPLGLKKENLTQPNLFQINQGFIFQQVNHQGSRILWTDESSLTEIRKQFNFLKAVTPADRGKVYLALILRP
jgi:hypothetical protein